MDWNDLKKKGYIEIADNRYDIRHLRVFGFKFSIPETADRPEINANMEVKFSSHCVSLGPKRGEVFDFNKIGKDHRIVDGSGLERRFCPERHEHSHRLRDIIRSIPEGRKCYFTGRENWIVVEVFGAGGDHQFYDIFFKLRRNSGTDLFMFLESAYVRNKNKKIPTRKVIGSKVLLGKTLRGEPIATPPT